MQLQNILGVIMLCIYLHNPCIIHGDNSNMEWVQKANYTMQMETNHLLGQFQHKDMFHVVEQAIKQMGRLQHLEGMTQVEEGEE